jgi:hypothetical protein
MGIIDAEKKMDRAAMQAILQNISAQMVRVLGSCPN